MNKQLIIFDYLPYCQPCLACCKNENIFLSQSEKQFFGEKKEGENCHNLLDDGRCSIHNNRPLECHIFPLDLKRIDNEIKWLLWNSCPATTAATIQFYEQEIANYEKLLTKEWIHDYISHHEKNEPEKYSGMNYTVIKTYGV